MSDDVWREHAETLGAYLREQRRLAELSLRDLAAQSQVSNAYLSQIERGLHQPSVRVLRAVAEALGVPAEDVLARAGLLKFADDGPVGTDLAAAVVEGALRSDQRLSDEQVKALMAVYRSYLPG